MTHTKKLIHTLFTSKTVSKDLDAYSKVLSWALLNFQLQSFLHQGRKGSSENITQELEEVGYKGRCIRELSESEFQNLFQKESFFSSSQTGKRIVSFALQENGLKQDRFHEIEDSITNAYKDVRNVDSQNELLEQSYRHCMDTLSIFKL